MSGKSLERIKFMLVYVSCPLGVMLAVLYLLHKSWLVTYLYSAHGQLDTQGVRGSFEKTDLAQTHS